MIALTVVVASRIRLMKNNECVGIGTVLDGDILHGHKIPKGFKKVVLEAVKPRLPPEMKGPFEDDFLCTGQFTAWPCNQMEFI